MEKMEYHKYSCIPIINERGKYTGTITEGDLLWGLKNRADLNLKSAEEVPITSFERRTDYTPIRVDSDMEDLLDKGVKLNYNKTLDLNVYNGFKEAGTTGLLNDPEVVTYTVGNGANGTPAWNTKTADEILHDINNALVDAWAASEYDMKGKTILLKSRAALSPLSLAVGASRLAPVKKTS